MSREYIYNVWAPTDGLWSRWVKPVLFACMDGPPPPLFPTTIHYDLSWVPTVESNTALVLDLPREEGVLMGLELARLGYRPVPLYNAVPKPAHLQLGSLAEGGYAPISLVEVEPIMHALWHGTVTLSRLSIPPNAPPVFLLDANRRFGGEILSPVKFDNRSVSFTTDFPSAIFLQTHGIARAVLVQSLALQPQSDLAHTLRRWQEGGIKVELKRLDVPGAPVACEIKRPSRFGAIWYRVREAMGLTRHSLGGYGGIIGQSSGG
jgi:hypothetical protein